MQIFGTAGKPCLAIELRTVGPATYEARCEDGRFSAVGTSERGAILSLLGAMKMPPHQELVVVRIKNPRLTARS